MADFKAIETQEEFNKAIQKRLEQKDREAAEKFKEYLSPENVASLKADHDKQIADLKEKLTKAEEKAAAHDQVVQDLQARAAAHDQVVQDLQARAATAESALLKSKVAHEHGVPIELADRLIGSTEEELKADADKVAKFLAPKSAPPLRSTEPSNVLMSTGNPDIDSKNAAAAAMLSFLPQLTSNT